MLTEEIQAITAARLEEEAQQADSWPRSCMEGFQALSADMRSFDGERVRSCSYARPSIRAISYLEERSQLLLEGTGDDEELGSNFSDPPNHLRDKAVVVIRRVRDKLTGLDFSSGTTSIRDAAGNVVDAGNAVEVSLDVPDQVNRLILQAMSNESLCQSFFGWCPFW